MTDRPGRVKKPRFVASRVIAAGELAISCNPTTSASDRRMASAMFPSPRWPATSTLNDITLNWVVGCAEAGTGSHRAAKHTAAINVIREEMARK